jgi:hypothetical protein
MKKNGGFNSGSFDSQGKKSIEKAYDSGYEVFREFVAELPNDEWVNLITTLDEYST